MHALPLCVHLNFRSRCYHWARGVFAYHYAGVPRLPRLQQLHQEKVPPPYYCHLPRLQHRVLDGRCPLFDRNLTLQLERRLKRQKSAISCVRHVLESDIMHNAAMELDEDHVRIVERIQEIRYASILPRFFR